MILGVAGSSPVTHPSGEGPGQFADQGLRPFRHLPTLAGLEIAGAVGILVGLWFEPLGIAAATGLVAYFLGAVGGHLRVGDTKNVAMPMPPFVLAVAVLAVAVLVLRLLTL